MYINQSLTGCRKRVLRQGSKVKGEKGIVFLWVDNIGTIKLRKRDGEKQLFVLKTREYVLKL